LSLCRSLRFYCIILLFDYVVLEHWLAGFEHCLVDSHRAIRVLRLRGTSGYFCETHDLAFSVLFLVFFLDFVGQLFLLLVDEHLHDSLKFALLIDSFLSLPKCFLHVGQLD
jgi:hypothetical protein